jgi:hypothetical protein
MITDLSKTFSKFISKRLFWNTSHVRVDIIYAEVTGQQSKCLLFIDWLPSIQQRDCLIPLFIGIPVH